MGGADAKIFYTDKVKKVDSVVITFGDEIDRSKKKEIIELIKEKRDKRIKRIKFEEGDTLTILFLKRMKDRTKILLIEKIKRILSTVEDCTSFEAVAPEDARGIKVIKKIENLSERVAWINPKKCVGCQECVTACPQGAIQNWGEKIFVIPEMCTFCKEKHCVKSCQWGAIKFVKRGGKSH